MHHRAGRKYILIHCFFITILILGCSRSPDVNYREYREGPHVFINSDSSKEIVYFKFKDSVWISTTQPTVEKGVIKVDNPVMPEFKVRIRDINSSYPSEYPAGSRIFVISDIEGNISSLIPLLTSQGVINDKGKWSYGDGHLVILGDVFDRGPDVTPILWLLYKLEAEAEQSNGKVHILMGNHENMIFHGDVRYIHSKYEKQSSDLGINYDSLYSMHTVLGQWIRHKPAVIKIGNLLLSHAGISPDIMDLELSLDAINMIVQSVNTNIRSIDGDLLTQEIFGSNGIFWYRDWVDYPGSEEELDKILNFYNAEHMIIGHTIVPDIKSLYNNKLMAIDIKNSTGKDGMEIYSLGYENGQFSVLSSEGGRKPVE